MITSTYIENRGTFRTLASLNGIVANLEDVLTRFQASKRVAFLLLLTAATAFAQVAPVPEAAPPTTPPTATEGFFPLSQVHAGLRGVAYTVFQGTKPEAMQVEILGVLRNALGPHRDLILSRLEGPKPEYTGVVAGMSGSPVYIDGKLLGALSYRIGQFSKEPIAGITPISYMLEVRDAQPDTNPDIAASPESNNTQTEIRPIETPLSLSGFSPEALTPFRDRLLTAGLSPVAGIGGSDSNTKQPEPIVPGSAVSALLVQGDLEMAGTCTVTYVDPKTLLACGHPITQYGAVSLPMTKADVVATLASPLNAFKIINTTEPIGAFNQDRASAIRGSFGETAKLIPVTLKVHDAHTNRTLRFQVIDNAQMTPLLLLLSTYQSLLESNDYGAETSYRIRGDIATNTDQSVKIDSYETPTEQMPSAIAAAIAMGDRFSRVYANRDRTLAIKQVSLDIEAEPGNTGLEIESAEPAQPTALAGQTIMIDTVVRPFHRAARHVQVPVALPASLTPGNLRVVISGAAELDKIVQSPSPLGRGDLDVDQTIAQLNATHTNNALYATVLIPGAQAVVDGRTLSNLPISMVNVMEPLRSSHRMTLNGESAVVAAAVPLDGMVTGQQVVTIEVK